uniref:TPR_REGION domain-containing protein n=2 Tax=Wuchereria bancrofti TaxID=6293 RepID=A0AAF5PQ46_WUCBA
MDVCKAMDVLAELKSLTQLRHELEHLPNTLLLPVARKCLDHFTLANYAGFIEKPVCGDYVVEEEIDKDLSFGCNSPYKFTRLKLCLWLAKTILIDCCSRLQDGFEKSCLTCRLVLLWQNLLKEPAVELEKILNTLEHVRVGRVSVAAVTEAFLEKMYAHLLYNQISRAEICLNSALTAIGLKIETVGVLGKRTRFQEKFIPQLIVRAVGGDYLEDDDARENESAVPPNVLLHDDSLLENVHAAEMDVSTSHAKLSALSLACMLASGVLERKIQSTEDLVVEKCCSLLDEIISQRRSWAVQASALLQRSEFDKISMRRVERACMQMESLSKLVNNVENNEVDESSLRKRLKLLLASGMKPFWYVNLVHAEILRSIGCTAEALVIFEKQENWDNVIDCYQSLGQLEKAEGLVRDLLAKNENESMYWCLLGDILHEPTAYEKAIEVSNGRSFRAHRSLGLLMLHRKHYCISYRHLKRSLELQPISSFGWFNFGCCAWKLEKWEEAAKAYRECVRYEPAHFQAWNNLAAVYERLNDLGRAKSVLWEALKLNFEHIKLRENYMLLCMRTHDLLSAITTFHAILDLDRQYKDDAVIKALTQKLIILREVDEEYVKRLTNKMCELLGRITSQQSCSSTIWHCYAELKRPNSESSVKDYEFYVKLLERAFGACYNKQDWYRSVDSCVAVLNAVIKLEDSKKVLSGMKSVENDLVKSETRITLRPLIASIEKTYGVDAMEASNTSLKELLLKVKSFLSSCL